MFMYQIEAFTTTVKSRVFIEDKDGLHTVQSAVAGELYEGHKTVQGDTVQPGDIIIRSAG